MSDENCIFCKIVHGKIASEKIYESEKVLGFMDISPLSQGHCLFIPKEHAVTLDKTSDSALSEILVVMKQVAKALNLDAYNILQNNGSRAHQAVMHVHFHLIPKPNEREGLGIIWNPLSDVDQKAVANRIRSVF